MTTFVVIPPSSKEQREVEADAYFVLNDGKTISFDDEDNEEIATYLVHPGTFVKKKSQ
jgi:hypothetical protein